MKVNIIDYTFARDGCESKTYIICKERSGISVCYRIEKSVDKRQRTMHECKCPLCQIYHLSGYHLYLHVVTMLYANYDINKKLIKLVVLDPYITKHKWYLSTMHLFMFCYLKKSRYRPRNRNLHRTDLFNKYLLFCDISPKCFYQVGDIWPNYTWQRVNSHTIQITTTFINLQLYSISFHGDDIKQSSPCDKPINYNKCSKDVPEYNNQPCSCWCPGASTRASAVVEVIRI